MESRENRRNTVLLHLSVMLFGLSGVLGRYITVSALVITWGRVVCSAVVLLLLLLLRRQSLRLERKLDWLLLIVAGAVQAVHWVTFFHSIQISSVAIGTITFSTFPLFLLFLEPLVFHVRFRPRNLLFAALLLLGVFITIPEFSLANQVTLGIVFGMICSLLYAVLVLFNRDLSRRYPSGKVCFFEQAAAAIILLPAALLSHPAAGPRDIVCIILIGVVCTALAFSMFVAAQRTVSTQTAGIVSGLETVYGIVFALLLLRAVPTAREIIGGVIILATAMLATWKSGES